MFRLIITPAAFLEERLRELTNLTVIRQLHILDCTVPDLEGPANVHLDFRLNVDEYFKVSKQAPIFRIYISRQIDGHCG